MCLSNDRLAKQRNIKRQQSQHPVIDMIKTEIEKECLDKYVIMPEMVDKAFSEFPFKTIKISHAI